MKANKHSKRDDLDAWLDEKRRTPAPEGFSDQVMERIASDKASIAKLLWRSPSNWAKAAILTLALAGGLGRYALLLICLFTG